ncbi:hypothetical protein [Acinetobacter sp.]|uniref:hypothetical protein n=1 Tax=Acinetobacter sp. TaxID=472 RepID=UPI00388F774C
MEYNTATRSDTCAKCYTKAKSKKKRLSEQKFIESFGYSNVHQVGYNKFGKPEWGFTHECGTEQVWAFNNFLSMSRIGTPCSTCGGKRRMAKAMDGYLAKYGITPEQLADLERYTKKVRGLTGKTYKLYEKEINPLRLKRGQGPDDYHLDHIMPIIQGFKENLAPEFVARKENLQMLSAFDNLSKGRK